MTRLSVNADVYPGVGLAPDMTNVIIICNDGEIQS